MTDFPVTMPVDVLWGDMDAFQHVNNTRYLTWFESARIALFGRIGISGGAPRGVGPILASTTCNFRVPVSFPAKLISAARIARVGNTSFVMEHAIWRAEDPSQVVADGQGVVVMVDYDTGQKVPVPAPIRAGIAAL